MRFKIRATILAAALALAVAPAAAAAQNGDSFEALWAKHSELLLDAGISKPMALHAVLWIEGQYLIGICAAYIDRDTVAYWRLWWKNTPLETSDIGKRLLQMGDDQYYEGIQDSRTKPLGRAHCKRVLDAWYKDMKAATF